MLIRHQGEEIRENEYNLNIPRYVDTFEEEELIDIDEVRANIASIEEELKVVQEQMDRYLKRVGIIGEKVAYV